MIRDAIGLDIGGANIKVATASGRAVTRPFELWKHPDQLATELSSLAADFPNYLPVAVTMTGELCDCFETKRDGVRHILAAVAQVFPRDRITVWSTEGRLLALDVAVDSYLSVAAANWHALATFAGRFCKGDAGLLIDIGSTTTDIIPILIGKPYMKGLTDPDRLASRELVYTGVSRTPLCAILGKSVAAELFATTKDVYLRLRMTGDDPDDRDTADGRQATYDKAHARLSRMLGGDPELTSHEDTNAIALAAFVNQCAWIGDAIATACERLPESPTTIILGGSGEFLARRIAESVFASLPKSSIISMRERFSRSVTSAACAFALAILATEMLP